MREMLFRGKRIDNGEWVYGDLIHIGSKSYITHCVDSDTVGQYTGLTDKNGKKIFEGDIVKVTGLYPDRDGEKRIWRQIRVGEVFYYHGAYYFDKWLLCKTSEKCLEVIGNIHDDPELLEIVDEP